MKVISLWFLLQQRNTNILSRQFKVNLVRCRNTEGSLDECRMLFERRFIHLFLLHTKHSSVTLNRFPRGNLKILPVNFWHPLSKLASLEVYLTDQTLPTCDLVFLAKKTSESCDFLLNYLCDMCCKLEFQSQKWPSNNYIWVQIVKVSSGLDKLRLRLIQPV